METVFPGRSSMFHLINLGVLKSPSNILVSVNLRSWYSIQSTVSGIVFFRSNLGHSFVFSVAKARWNGHLNYIVCTLNVNCDFPSIALWPIIPFSLAVERPRDGCFLRLYTLLKSIQCVFVTLDLHGNDWIYYHEFWWKRVICEFLYI